MARERYLVGVDEEDLERKPSPSAPMTLKGWIANFWYHYKWVVIGTVFAVAALTVMTVQVLTKEKPDYEICMGVEGYVPEAVIEIMEAELAPYGQDLNGDGEVIVSIQNLNVSDGDTNANLTVSSANRQTVAIHVATRDIVMFALSPDYHDSLVKELMDGATFLHPLEAEGAAGDGTYFVWDVEPLLPQALKAYAPGPLYVGVRTYTDQIDDEKREKSDQALELLRAYLADRENVSG